MSRQRAATLVLRRGGNKPARCLEGHAATQNPIVAPREFIGTPNRGRACYRARFDRRNLRPRWTNCLSLRQGDWDEAIGNNGARISGARHICLRGGRSVCRFVREHACLHVAEEGHDQGLGPEGWQLDVDVVRREKCAWRVGDAWGLCLRLRCDHAQDETRLLENRRAQSRRQVDGAWREEGHCRSSDNCCGTVVVRARIFGLPRRQPFFFVPAAILSETSPSLLPSDALIFF